MKPAPFEFVAPDTEEEVRELLARHGEEARLLAGGQSLVPLLNMRLAEPQVVIGLGRCAGLAGLAEEGAELVCGAMVRQAEALDSPRVGRQIPLLAAALAHVGVPASRNFGTLCGSLAHADPSAELPAVATALEARMVIASARGEREVEASEFFEGPLATCLEADEMLRAVRLPAPGGGPHQVFLEIANRAHGSAIAGIAALIEIDDGVCREARLAAVGMGMPGLRLAAAEATVRGQALEPQVIEEAAAAARAAVEPDDDLHAAAAYRRHLAGVLVGRALEQARDEEAAR